MANRMSSPLGIEKILSRPLLVLTIIKIRKSQRAKKLIHHTFKIKMFQIDSSHLHVAGNEILLFYRVVNRLEAGSGPIPIV